MIVSNFCVFEINFLLFVKNRNENMYFLVLCFWKFMRGMCDLSMFLKLFEIIFFCFVLFWGLFFCEKFSFFLNECKKMCKLIQNKKV